MHRILRFLHILFVKIYYVAGFGWLERLIFEKGGTLRRYFLFYIVKNTNFSTCVYLLMFCGLAVDVFLFDIRLSL